MNQNIGSELLTVMQNDIELMFGAAEVNQGDIMIPPYTFPDFASTDLQWTIPEGLL